MTRVKKKGELNMAESGFNRRKFLQGSLVLPLARSPLQESGTVNLPRDPSEVAKRIEENDQIQTARKVALDILAPSSSQLEHGLELHSNSVVFDAYGFSPRAALDTEILNTAVEEGASTVELRDLREEMTMTRPVSIAEETEEYLDAWDAAGVTCVFQNAGEEGQNPLRLIKRLARFTYVTDFLKGHVSKAARPEEVEKASEENRHCLYFTGNGVPLTQDWTSVEDELRYVRIFFQLGIRMMHLTYNRRNMIGDGCAEPANAGLSDFGRAVIAEMNRIGIIPDVAHSGWQTSLEAARISDKPVVASHSGCVSVNEHFRCKPDDVIRAISDSGGYIGICCIPRFLGGDISAFLDHIDYAVQTFGPDHVAIGTDVAYRSRLSQDQVIRMPESRDRWAALWPPDPFQTTTRQVQSVAWTNWPLFTIGMVQRGYSDEDIQKIVGGNVFRVARETLS